MSAIIRSMLAGWQASNLHFCFYAAFGVILLIRSGLSKRVGRVEEAAEHRATGLIHLLLAWLLF